MLDEQGGQHSEEGEHLCIVVSVVVSVVVVCCASLPVAGSEELCSAGPIGIHPSIPPSVKAFSAQLGLSHNPVRYLSVALLRLARSCRHSSLLVL